MSNSNLTHTASTGNQKTWTFSCWFRISHSDGIEYLISQGSAGNQFVGIYLGNEGSPTGGGTLRFYNENSGSQSLYFQTNRILSDNSNWYHVVVQCDTTQSTESERVKIWINGVQETSFASSSYPAQDSTTNMNVNSSVQRIGVYNASGSSANHYFDGYMSHVALVDGAVVAPTSFGSTDSTSGIWKFKPPSGITWGTNGFHLKFENSGNLGLDSSGQGNNFTVNGNLKQSVSTPTNTLTTLMNEPSRTISGTVYRGTLSDAGTKFDGTGVTSGSVAAVSNYAVNKGKWYAEFKLSQAGQDYARLGVATLDGYNQTSWLGNADPGNIALYQGNDGAKYVGSTSSSYGATYNVNDIIGIAMDLDNNTITFYKNGTSQGAISIADTDTYKHFHVNAYDGTGSDITKWECNFGEGRFGTTAISSAGSNGNGYLFEYDVPANHYALSTKNINTYG
tara:strand:- start:2483 stop:3835 length:1353 start_codon:yes stop_codon:yes gene_type:complete